MKRFLFILTALLIINPAFAKNIKVEAMSDFSTANPPKTWQVRVVEGFVTTSGFKVNSGSIIEGRIEDVKSAKRLKRDSSFKFIPEFYYDEQIGSAMQIKKDFIGKYNKLSEVDAKTIAKKGAVTAGNILITPFLGAGVALVEGTVKNEEGNRAKSAAVSVYENTPLSLCNKGHELEFTKGEIFIMNFKVNEDEENRPNYSYKLEE